MTHSLDSIEKDCLPGLYYAADQTAISEQKAYLQLFWWILALTIAGVAASIVAPLSPMLTKPSRILAGLCLVVTVVLTGIMKSTQREKKWYGARAVAESVKTMAWRYMMQADPYSCGMNMPECDRKFTEALSALLAESKTLSFAAAGSMNAKQQITDCMVDVRELSFKERLSIYMAQRVGDQRSWYTKKASASATSEGRYFLWIFGFQTAAFISAFVLAGYETIPINATSLFANVAAALLAWLQIKRFQETSQSYSLASHEVGVIEVQARHISNDVEFGNFVKDAENAFSREHTMWVARRDTK